MPSIPIPHLYRSLHEYLLQRLPDTCDSRLANLIFLMMGIFQSGGVQLHLEARKTPIRAQKLSIVKRLAHFLDNGVVRVRAWFHPFFSSAAVVGSPCWRGTLDIDTTKVAFGFRLVMVSLAYRRRSLPVAWTWLKGSRGHSSTATQVKLLGYVQRLLPKHSRVSLVGDCGFGTALLIEYLTFWGWDYALRQTGDNLVMLRGTNGWQCIDALHPRLSTLLKGQAVWIGRLLLTKTSPYPTHLVLYWQRGEKKPRYLATNLLDARRAVRLYRRRMWIEEMFGDLKKRGFDLEASHLWHLLRLSRPRLTLVVCLLYLWIILCPNTLSPFV